MTGRFAPSPTGPLHGGSLVAAMASWLDVRAHGGRWLLRIEDIDRPREVRGAAEGIVATLAALGFRWNGPVVRQSGRNDLYQRAFDVLRRAGSVYPCGCTRQEIHDAASAGDGGASAAIYPGTCRDGLPPGRAARAWRLRVAPGEVVFDDRAAGMIREDTFSEVGDFIVRRADGYWAYQLAVVVDDADQGVTDVVRGADLLGSTARQRVLQDALGLPRPRTLHVPLVVDASGAKLGKSTAAQPLEPSRPMDALKAAARHLELEVPAITSLDDFWESATVAWAKRWRLDATGR
ncbi:MAG: tRNA glutamyl-Q(34) synthetase GluQRS [Burkholderiaceae bacterium]